jgi:CMP-N-acetylneuraminic acid synthetase
MMLAIIPARSGSKGVPNKNLQEVGGVPLLVRALRHAQVLLDATKPVLSSDSLLYASVASTHLGGEQVAGQLTHSIFEYEHFYFHLRSRDEASDDALIAPLIAEVSSSFEAVGVEHSHCLLLQPTSPFRTVSELREVIPQIANNFELASDSLVSVRKVDDGHPARMYRLSRESGRLRKLRGFGKFEKTRRQYLEEIYLRDGGYYLSSKVSAQSSLHFGKSPLALIRDNALALNVDSRLDLMLANDLLNSGIVEGDPNENNR